MSKYYNEERSQDANRRQKKRTQMKNNEINLSLAAIFIAK